MTNLITYFPKLIDALDIASFREVGGAINETVGNQSHFLRNFSLQCKKIDWEESNNADRVCVRQHIDEELDNRKHVYNGIDTVLVS
jgi:DNA mismatch repair protein MSH5